MRLKLAGTLILAGLAGEVGGHDGVTSYLCESTSAVGFKFSPSEGRWVPAIFEASHKFHVRPFDRAKEAIGEEDYPKHHWDVVRVGEPPGGLPDAYCKEDFTGEGWLFCKAIGGDFTFDKENMRFLHSYALGYWGIRPGKSDATSDTPYMEIGTCAEL